MIKTFAMKAPLLSIFTCILFTINSYGQSAANFYNRGKFLADKANASLEKMKVFNQNENNSIIDLYKSAAENYIKAKNEMPALSSQAHYNAAVNLFHASQQYQVANDMTNAYAQLVQFAALWPRFNEISENETTKEKSIFSKGFIYTFPACGLAGDRYKNYYQARYLLAQIAESLGKKEEAMQCCKEIADEVGDMPAMTWICSYKVAEAKFNDQKYCDAGIYALVSIVNASKVQPDGTTKEIAFANSKIDEMTRYVAFADSTGCLSRDMLEKAVATMSGMHGNWAPKTKIAYMLGEKVVNKGGHSFDLLLSEYKLARKNNDPEISETWRQRLIKYGKNFSSLQWKELADYFGTLSYTEAVQDALENAKKKEKRENSSYMIGIEPTSIVLGQYAISFAHQGIKLCHELRVGYIFDGVKPFLKSGADTEKVPLYLLTHYNGYQVSYSMKFLSKGEVKNTLNYVGYELRYTARNYTDSLVYYNKSNTSEFKKANLNPHADVYDACLIFGGINKGKFLYMDIFGGIGVGYKTISYNSQFDPIHYAVANAPYKAGIWDKIYVPIRVGIKVGFVVR